MTSISLGSRLNIKSSVELSSLICEVVGGLRKLHDKGEPEQIHISDLRC